MLTDVITTSLSFLAPKNKSVLFQLVLAFFIASFLLFIKIWIPDIGRYSPFLLFSSAVILCGWFAGLVSSLTLTVLSALLVTFVLISPLGTLTNDPAGSVQPGLFIVECFFLSFFVEYVKRMRSALVQHEQLTKILLNASLEEAIIILDGDNTIVGWSTGAQKLFGYKEEEIKSKPITMLCDKKNWFDQKAHVLQVRVTTRYIFSTGQVTGIKIKIIRDIRQKNFLESQEKYSLPAPIPANTVSSSSLL